MQVDEIIDQNIQINSNKQMRHEYLYQWTLKFKDPRQEIKYCELREDMFRSNVICVYIIWLFILSCQLIIEHHCNALIINLSVSTAVLTIGVVVVMADEFQCCNRYVRSASAALVNRRNMRTWFICLVVTIMAVSSAAALFSCPMETSIKRDLEFVPFAMPSMKPDEVSPMPQDDV